MLPAAWAERIAACAAPLGVAILFAVPWITGAQVPAFDQRALGEILQVEFIVLGGGLFLVFPLLAPVSTRFGRWMRRIVFLGLAAVFAAGASEYGGFRSVFTYFGLLYATFGGAMVSGGAREHAGSALAFESFGRWLLGVAIFFPLVVAFDMGGGISSWARSRRVVPAGALYFLGLTLLELLFYPWLKRQAQRVGPLR